MLLISRSAIAKLEFARLPRIRMMATWSAAVRRRKQCSRWRSVRSACLRSKSGGERAFLFPVIFKYCNQLQYGELADRMPRRLLSSVRSTMAPGKA
jgi:hypothetical protein